MAKGSKGKKAGGPKAVQTGALKSRVQARSIGDADARRFECVVGESPPSAPSAERATFEPMRADRYIAEILGVLSRSQIKARGAAIFVEGKSAKLSRPLKPGEHLLIEWTEEAPLGLVAEDIPLVILYEDERVFVIDKPQGMVTHPGHGNRRGTLANAILGRLAAERVAREMAGEDAKLEEADESDFAEADAEANVGAAGIAAEGRGPATRGGIVHRLDKDTSGLIIVAKDAEAQAFLAAQFKSREARKEYLALVRGRLPAPSGRVENRLGRDRRDRKRFAAVLEGGKVAVTDYRVLAIYGEYALVLCKPRTGRTHQIRVHMAGLGCPILGDPIYGKKDGRFPNATLMLHAYRLQIRIPGTKTEEPEHFKAPAPPRFRRLVVELERLFGRT